MGAERSGAHDAWTAFVDGLRAAGDQLAADTADLDPVQQTDGFRALVRGLVGPGVQLVVSAGASFDALASLAGDDVLIFRRVPQLAVLRAVDVVVSHGGNNTVNETLMAGRPLLVLPIGGEQEANARRVEAIGAGISLARADLSADTVRAAFARLRGTPSYRERADAIGKAVGGMNGVFFSANDGQSWQRLGTANVGSTSSLAIGPRHVFAATTAGVQKILKPGQPPGGQPACPATSDPRVDARCNGRTWMP